MNILKSVNIAIAMRGISKGDLAERLGMKPQNLSRTINKERCTSTALEAIAAALDMKVSEFLALGEEK